MGTAALNSNLIQQLTYMREAVLHEIFLDVLNAYDTLDQERFLDILMTYGVVTRVIRFLQTYWCRLTIVDNSGGYYAPPPLQGIPRCNPVRPLSPTIFNVTVADVVVQRQVKE